MLRGATVGILVAATLAVCATPANAITFSDLQLNYTATTTNWSSWPGREDQSTYDDCSQALVGMGGWLSEAGQENPNRSTFKLGRAWFVSIHPEDQYPGAPVPDSTHEVADSLFQIDNDLTLGESTVCAVAATDLTYPSTQRATKPRARTRLGVDCPADAHVLSGGALADGEFRAQRLVSSAPFDSADAGRQPDDGWRVAVDNLDPMQHQVQAFAICAGNPGLSYVSKAFRSPKRSRRHAEVSCPEGEYIIGGGASHRARFGKATVVASRFAQLQHDGWITEVDNLSRKRAAGRAFAICHA